MTEELIQASAEAFDLITDENMPNEQCDNTFMSPIELPTFDDTNDTKVLKNVRDVFKGFSFEATGNVSKMFADVDTIADYIKKTTADIKGYNDKAQATSISIQGACLARFWYMANYIRRALSEGTYGEAVYDRLASMTGYTVGYVYAISAIAAKLSPTECYLLGVRGLTVTNLKHLCSVKDNDIRKQLIRAFIDATPDTGDMERMEAAKKALSASLRAGFGPSYLEAATSDPVAGGTEIKGSQEYVDTMNQIALWKKMLKKLASDGPIEEFVMYLSNFFMSESTPGAETYVEEVKDAASNLKTIIQAVKNNLDDAIAQIDSLTGVEVLKDEDTAAN